MTVTRGFEAVSTSECPAATWLMAVSKTGDPSLRLEKFLLDWVSLRALPR
jgi:hypothetical protein